MKYASCINPDSILKNLDGIFERKKKKKDTGSS